MTLADRLRSVEGSPTLALAAKAKALAKAGKPVIDFTAGEPDAPTPEHIKEAGLQAIRNNQTRYTPVAGIPELRLAIAETVNRQRRTIYRAEQVMVSCGTKHALYNIFQTLCQPGDEVIVLSPYWVSFPPIVHLSGATPVIVAMREADGFLPDPSAIARAVTPKTKAIILNSPSNPTGAVVDEARLRAIAELARQHKLVVVSDEIYDQLVYAPAVHRSILEVAPDLKDHTVLVGGVSKTYSMTGWRIGWALGPQAWVDAMINVQSHSTSNATSISQAAAVAALTGDQAPVARMREQFQARRDRMVNGLNRVPGLRCAMPGGAFYAWCNVSGLGQPAAVTAEQWIDEAMVVTVPGDGFGASDHIRLSFAASTETIDEGLKRLERWAAQQRHAAPASKVR